MSPATPKYKLGSFLKAPATPTLTDGSLRGEQKRTAILETQLKEVSVTASKAYDEMENLKLRNDMLEDQVLQQKQLIESLMQQLEDASKENEEIKSKKEKYIRQKLEEQSEDSARIAKINQENSRLLREIEHLRVNVQNYEKLYQEKSKTLPSVEGWPQGIKEIEKTEKSDGNVKLGSQQKLGNLDCETSNVNDYEEVITRQKEKIVELESIIELKNSSYTESLTKIRNSMLVLRANKMFLSRPGYSTNIEEYQDIDEDFMDRGDGDTFVFSNFTFIP